MTSFVKFCEHTKLRHDFDDQIQVRYTHSGGQEYDTWVSGEEVIRRIQSEDAEAILEGLSNLDRSQIEKMRKLLPDIGRNTLKEYLANLLADKLAGFIGGNIIGDNLADAVRSRRDHQKGSQAAQELWKSLLRDKAFQLQVKTLAWIQLRGSFPGGDVSPQPDDWL